MRALTACVSLMRQASEQLYLCHTRLHPCPERLYPRIHVGFHASIVARGRQLPNEPIYQPSLPRAPFLLR